MPYPKLVKRYGYWCRLQVARRRHTDAVDKLTICRGELCYCIRWHIGVDVCPAYMKLENLDTYLEQFKASWQHYMEVSGIKESELEAYINA